MVSKSVRRYEPRVPVKDADGKIVRDPETGKMVTRKTGQVVWRARYRDADGREHSRHFARQADGKQWLDEVTTSILTGKYVQPKAGKVKFRTFAEDWLNDRIQRDATEQLYRGHLERHVYPVIGSKNLDSITSKTITRLVKRLHEGVEGERAPLAPATVGVVYKVLASVFRDAVRARKIAETPCVDIKLPEVSKARIRPLTTEQVELLAERVPEQLRALVILAAGAGLRQGELLGLTRDRLVLDSNPRVVVDRQLVTKTGGGTDFAKPKTDASYRTVPLPRVVVEALETHLEMYGVGERSLLFTLDGRPITRQRFGHVFRPVGREVGLTEETGTGVHALRHYYASLLIRYGESVKTVQARLGHKSATETLDTYGHLWGDSDERTRDAVDTVLLARADYVRTTLQEDPK